MDDNVSPNIPSRDPLPQPDDLLDPLETQVDPESLSGQAIRREISDFQRTHEQRRRQLPRAILVGVMAGLAAVLFRGALLVGDRFRERLYVYAHAQGLWGILLPMAYAALGAGLAVMLVQRFAPETSGSGIPQIKGALHHLRLMDGRRILPVKFAGGLFGIGAGLALGREGPTVQMGGAVGQIVGQWLKTTPRERQTLIAAGAGAGLAAAFNAPLAGVMFVLEELQRDFSPNVLTASFISCVTADVVCRMMLGQLPVFHVSSSAIPSLIELPIFIVLGVVAGVFGVLYNRCLLGSLNLFAKARKWVPGATGALVGASIGMVGWFYPEALGGGHLLAERTMEGRLLLEAIPLLFVLRFAANMFSYGCGAPGGIFAPLLALGAQLGLGVGELAQRGFPNIVLQPEAYAIVGMASYFIAIVRAPLTGIVLILEMTGNYNLLFPLIVAGVCAYGVADLLRDEPIYEALLERDLLRGRARPQLDETLLLDLTLYPGCPFEGKTVRELGLPPGCILVSIHHGMENRVPTADTTLHAGDRITAVVAPKAAHAVGLLKEGTSR